MPTCTCESHACNGKDVTPRAFENHQREDKRRKFSQAYAKATQVCNKQNDDVAAYISSLTLSDSATGGIPAPGGRLWSRSVQDDDVDDIAAYISSLALSDSATRGISAPGGLSPRSIQDDDVLSSLKLADGATGSDAVGGLCSTDTLLASHRGQASPRYAPINDMLSELDSIEKELGSLLLASRPQLRSLTTPLSRDEPFPLKPMISAACLLRDRLSSVSNKTSSVRKRKTDISDRLNAYLEELMKRNTLWNKEMNRLSKKDKEIIPTYETSVYSTNRLFEVTNRVVQLIILRLPYQMLIRLSRYRCLRWLPCKLFFISVVAVVISFFRCSDT